MNIFEGSRRIAKMIGVLMVAGTFIGLFAQDTTVFLRYKSLPTGQLLLDADDDCRIGIDGIDGDDFVTKNRNKFRRSFCFVATRADNGALLVPYKWDGNNLLLNQPYSDEVKTHMNDFISRHPPTEKEFEQADHEYRVSVAKRWLQGLGFLLLGLLFYWAVIWAAGWIVRGFLGIPRGQDYRIVPASKNKDIPV